MSKDDWIPQWCKTMFLKKDFFSSLNHRWFTLRKNTWRSCLADCMRKPRKVSSSLNHRWFYSYGKPLKFLSRELSEKTHKGFISKPFKTFSVLKWQLFHYFDINRWKERTISFCPCHIRKFSSWFQKMEIIFKPFQA